MQKMPMPIHLRQKHPPTLPLIAHSLIGINGNLVKTSIPNMSFQSNMPSKDILNPVAFGKNISIKFFPIPNSTSKPPPMINVSTNPSIKVSNSSCYDKLITSSLPVPMKHSRLTAPLPENALTQVFKEQGPLEGTVEHTKL